MKVLARPRVHRHVVAFAVAFLVIGTLATAIWFRTQNAGRSEAILESPYVVAPLAKTEHVNALFVGDDFTAGYGGVGRNAYPRIVCNRLRMNCNVDARAGTRLVDPKVATGPAEPHDLGAINGDATESQDSMVLIDRIAADEKLYAVDLLIVDAGRNDLEAPMPAFRDALDQYLRRAVEIWPEAKIVVIAPTYFSPEPLDVYEGRLREIDAAVTSVGGILVDPIAEGWYQNADGSTLLQEDGTHPNQVGHQFIAEKLQQSLVSRGIGLEGNSR